MSARPLPRRRLTVALAALAVGGCAAFRRGAVADTPAPLGDADRHFALDAAASLHYQLEAARLAEQRSTDPLVRSYAALLTQENTRAADELKALVQARGLAWVDGVPAERRAMLDAMATLAAELFDRRFIEQVGIADHGIDLAMFEAASRSVADAALRRWAERMVPVLRHQLNAAQQLPLRLQARA